MVMLRIKYKSIRIMLLSRLLLSFRGTAIDGRAVLATVCNMRAPSKLIIWRLYSTCAIVRYGMCFFCSSSTSPSFGKYHVSGVRSSTQAKAILDFILLFVSFSGHNAKIWRRSPPTRLCSAMHLATSMRLFLSSNSRSHFFKSLKHARASSPSS